MDYVSRFFAGTAPVVFTPTLHLHELHETISAIADSVGMDIGNASLTSADDIHLLTVRVYSRHRELQYDYLVIADDYRRERDTVIGKDGYVLLALFQSSFVLSAEQAYQHSS